MKAIVLFTLLCVTLSLSAQELKEIKVGDQFPDYEFKYMMNYPRKTMRMSDFKGKLVILDFWGTGCTSCVQAWPKILKLQKQFEGKLQIVLVNKYQDEKLVKAFAETRRKLLGVDMNLPMSNGDTTLQAMFPFRTVPRYYWIDGEGKVLHITYGPSVNEVSIGAVLSGKKVSLTQIKDSLLRIDTTKPVFIDGNGGQNKSSNVLSYSIIARSPDNLLGYYAIRKDSIVGSSLTISGMGLAGLYWVANDPELRHKRVPTTIFYNRLKVIAKDTSLFYNAAFDSTFRSLLYQHKDTRYLSTPELQAILSEDLARYFDVKVTWETMERWCLVLSMTDSTLSHRNNVTTKGLRMDDTEFLVTKLTVDDILEKMITWTNYFRSPYPIVNETKLNGSVGTIHIKGPWQDYKYFDKELARYGFRFTLQKRLIDVLVLREKTPPKF